MKKEIIKNVKMPVWFLSHGDPMNAIRDNIFTRNLYSMASSLITKPKAILMVSAHWLTKGSYISTNENPETIHDFSGFPEALYQIQYPALGSPHFANKVLNLLPIVKEDKTRGLDHGSWSVLRHAFPKADVPVFQLSIDYYKPMKYHYDLSRKLRELRDEGVLIIGSGNTVHNIPMYFTNDEAKPFDWAIEFDEWVKKKINARDFESLLNYEILGNAAKLSIPTVDHYVPMIYILPLIDKDEQIRFTHNDVIRSMSMMCFTTV